MEKIKAFINYIKSPSEGVKPFGAVAALLILAVLGVIDIYACVALIIAGFVFVKTGHKGMGILLCLTNLFLPDALPVVDEAVGIAAVVIPMYIKWKKTDGNIAETIASGITSRKEHKKNRKEKLGMNKADAVKAVTAELQSESQKAIS